MTIIIEAAGNEVILEKKRKKTPEHIFLFSARANSGGLMARVCNR